MFIIKSGGGGVNKVLIDNKPPADRLNLTETTSILRNKTIGLRSFSVLSRKNNTFYVKNDSKILKGNPYTNWTEIFSESNPINGSVWEMLNINDDDSVTLTTASLSDSGSTVYFYKIKNGVATYIRALSVRGRIETIFKFGDETYIYTVHNSRGFLFKNNASTTTLTDITSNITFENSTSFSHISNMRRQTTFLDKRYQVFFDSNTVKIIEFDGKKVRVLKELNNSIEVNEVLPEQYTAVNADEMYITLISKADAYNKRKYQLLDKNFEVVESGETIFAIKDGYFIKKDNDTHIYIMKEISDARDSVFVEFPVKAYVRKE